MPRRLKTAAVVLAVAAGLLFALLPPGARPTNTPPAGVVRGAFHIHSTRSDGSGAIESIAAAAARAGLQFIVVTDHGDGTRPVDSPAYLNGVLTIDGVELNTTGGHYAVFGMQQAPFPVAGTPEDVIEDVHRFGGFGVAAHPGSPRPSLSWQAWDAPIDGLEWLNADSEWRDEPRIPIARALISYFFRGPESMARLLDRPVSVLRKWDELAVKRKIVALAGADAHARLGFRQGPDPDTSSIHVRLPGYEESFRTFSNHVVIEAPLTGDAQQDAERVMTAIRNGHVYSVIDALATPGSLAVTATSGSQSARIGDHLAISGDVVLTATAIAPPGTTLVLFRDGQRIHEATDGPLEMNGGKDPGVYRIEAYTANAPGGPAVPWIVSNPIYAGLAGEPVVARVPEPVSRIPARAGEAAAENGARDTSAVDVRLLAEPRARTFAGDPSIHWDFTLSNGRPSGQFAAVAIPVSPGLADFDRVRFRVTASAPMRVWVQLRAAVGNTERFGRTFYADAESRIVDLPFATFAPIGVTSSARAPLDRVSHLLFVADTLNTLPGKSGSMTISELGFVR
jgi:hypothetical protein